MKPPLLSLAVASIAAVAVLTHAQDKTPPVTDAFAFTKPSWITDLSLKFQMGYDNNLLGVSGDGLRPKDSAFSVVSPRVGFDFAPLIGDGKSLQSVSFSYTPDYWIYYDAPQETYQAHKFNNAIQGKWGDFSCNLKNSFLYNDGSTVAPTYAVNQLSAANENDRFRNFYAFAMPRERRQQIQDRASAVLQYDCDPFFVRPTASFLYYDMQTDLRNAGAGLGNVGYQNFPDRYDVNGGADIGYRIAKPLAVTLGYRYGHQYQQQLPLAISPGDRHFSSSDYQQALLGFEGTWKFLTYKVACGPDFRSYNSMAPVDDFNPIKYYGEAAISARISTNQSLTFNYRQWQWVSAIGLVPYFDSSFMLSYHWDITRQWSVDLAGRILEADLTGGNETGIQNPTQVLSVRDDRLYTIQAGVTYAITTRLTANLNYSYDIGRNVLDLPPAFAATESFRNFTRHFVTAGVQYRF